LLKTVSHPIFCLDFSTGLARCEERRGKHVPYMRLRGPER
jgi:hypothetical protein